MTEPAVDVPVPATPTPVAAPAPPPAPVLTLASALTLVAAAGLFIVVARRVTSKASEPTDEAVRDWTRRHRSSLGDAAVRPVTVLSMPGVVLSATAGLAWWLYRAGRRDAALALLVAPVLAASAGLSFSTFLEQRNPPDAGDASSGEVVEPSFPSGHTAGVTAEALSVAYVLAREGLVAPAAIVALVAWPALLGITRVYRDRHWVSDVFGGWASGTAVAATSALLYDALTARRGDA